MENLVSAGCSSFSIYYFNFFFKLYFKFLITSIALARRGVYVSTVEKRMMRPTTAAGSALDINLLAIFCTMVSAQASKTVAQVHDRL